MHPDELFANVVTHMRVAPSLHSAELAEELLRICRGAGGQLRVAIEDADLRYRRNGMTSHFRKLLQESGSALLLSRVLNDLATAMNDCVLTASKPLIARALAVALDEQFGMTFYNHFARRGSLIVRAETAFPRKPSRTYRLVVDPSGDPGLRKVSYDSLEYLALAPTDMRGLELEIIFCDRYLPELTKDTTFGVGVVGADIDAEYHWRAYDAPSPVFFDVKPKDPVAHRERLLHLVRCIGRDKPQVVVLPELSFTDDLVHELQDQPALQDVPLLVLGSRHTSANGGGGSNVASVYARGRLIGEHRKFRPVVLPDKRSEHLINATPRLTIFSSPQLTVATAICKDAIDPDVFLMWRAAGVNLVLIPAMSPGVEDFSTVAHNLGGDPQAFTVIANTGGMPVLLGRPCREKRVISLSSPFPELVMLGVSGDRYN